MASLRGSFLIPWLIATIGFPVGGAVGHLVAGPAATVPAALLSGLAAGAVIGAGQALALRRFTLVPFLSWVVATGVGLGVALAVMTALTGQIETSTEAIGLGVLSGLAIGIGQAGLLVRDGRPMAWVWVVASALAWAVGWLVATGIGVSLDPGWAVYGTIGALCSQAITGAVIWRLFRDPSAVAA